MSLPVAPVAGLKVVPIAQAVLNQVVAYFMAAGVPLPERRYLAPGSPAVVAWDCEQVTCALAGVGNGRARDATQVSTKFGHPWSATTVRHLVLSVQIVRRVGELDALVPAVEDIAAAAEQSMIDQGCLSQALVDIVINHPEIIPPGGSVQAGAIEPMGVSGGYYGCEGVLVMTAGELL